MEKEKGPSYSGVVVGRDREARILVSCADFEGNVALTSSRGDKRYQKGEKLIFGGIKDGIPDYFDDFSSSHSATWYRAEETQTAVEPEKKLVWKCHFDIGVVIDAAQKERAKVVLLYDRAMRYQDYGRGQGMKMTPAIMLADKRSYLDDAIELFEDRENRAVVRNFRKGENGVMGYHVDLPSTFERLREERLSGVYFHEQEGLQPWRGSGTPRIKSDTLTKIVESVKKISG
ncbi:hypothetical protein ACFLZX_00235 [Nanoarchaeota archaeon]